MNVLYTFCTLIAVCILAVLWIKLFESD